MRFRTRFWIGISLFILLGFFIFGSDIVQLKASGIPVLFEYAFAGAIVQHSLPDKMFLAAISNCIIPVLLFELLFGTYIYSDVERCGVYIFTRVKKRHKWYINKVFKLFGLSLLINGVFTATGGITVLLLGGKTDTPKNGFILLGCLLLTYTLFGFIVAMAVNVIAVLSNSGYAFSIVNILLVLMLAMVVIQDVSVNPNDYTFTAMFRFNPIANLVPPWHNYTNKSLDLVARELIEISNFTYQHTGLFLGTIALLIVMAGLPIFNKMQIIFLTKENE